MRTLILAILLFIATSLIASPIPPEAINKAKKDVGIVEATNNNDGARIEQIQRTAGIPIHLSYCMASVYTWYDEGSKSISLKNPLPRTGRVMDMYKIAKANPSKYKWIPVESIVKRQERLKAGDIIIWKYTELTGHTGLVEMQVDNFTLQSIEGNTSLSNAVDAQREQARYSKNRGGIFRKIRYINVGSNMRLLGVVRVR